MSEKNQPPTPELTSPRLERLLNAAARIEQEIILERATLARLGRLEDDTRVATYRTHEELAAFVERAVDAVEQALEVSRVDLFGQVRHPDVNQARHVLMWIVRTQTGASYPTLGRVFGRHHTSVVNACQRVDRSPRLTEVGHRVLTRLHVTALAYPA